MRPAPQREPDIDPGTEGVALAAPVDGRELGAIFAGGFLGALARAALSQALGVAPQGWPWPTFAVNIAAAGLLGYVIARLGARGRDTLYARAFLASGLCAALGTFSTVMLELIHLAEHDRTALACAYAAASVAGGLAAVVVGMRLGKRGGEA
ncbi:MAG: crcB1 [Solirubrobacterales bacterium]|nr:crcB1 [Solirubrobacterales bacterium]